MTSKELEAAARRLVMRGATTAPSVRGRAAIILDRAVAIAEAGAQDPTPSATKRRPPDDVVDLRTEQASSDTYVGLLHPLY